MTDNLLYEDKNQESLLMHVSASIYSLLSNTSVLTSYFHKDNAKWAYIISRELSEFEIQGPGKK